MLFIIAVEWGLFFAPAIRLVPGVFFFFAISFCFYNYPDSNVFMSMGRDIMPRGMVQERGFFSRIYQFE